MQTYTVDDSLLSQMAQAIVREIDPRQIILFGSRARGDARPDSDVDLLVVQDHPFVKGQGRLQQEVKLWIALAEFRVAKDILIYTPAEMEKWRESKNHLIGRVAREGKVLYERLSHSQFDSATRK